jgi:uncharacterized membrane protein YvlD (DUF360 family)
MRFLLRVVVSAAALAFWGAIIVGLVSWLLHLLIGDNRPRENEPPPVRVVRVR